MTHNRIAYIDILKGTTITLVVVGHVIQYLLCPLDYSQDIVFRLIYGFHMQLFVLLSGMTVVKEISSLNQLGKIILKRFRQLIIPFLSWAILSALIHCDISIIFSVIINPGSGLWFLWDLFFIGVFYYCAIYLRGIIKTPVIVPIIIAFLILSLIVIILKIFGLSSELFDILRIMRLFPFFVLGSFVSSRNIVNYFNNKCIFIILLFLYILLVIFRNPSFLDAHFSLSPYLRDIIDSVAYRLLVSLVGCAMSLSFAILSESLLKNTIINTMGRKTLGIYAIHLFLIHNVIIYLFNILTIPYNALSLVIVTISLISLTMMVYYFLEKSKLTGQLFLGLLK